MTLRRAAQNVVDVWNRYRTAESLRGWMEILEKELTQMNKCDKCGKVTRDGDVHTCTPKALWLVERLAYVCKYSDSEHWDDLDAAATELRRLHEENERLNAVHQKLRGVTMRLMMYCNDLEIKLDEDGEHPAMVKAREALGEKP